MKLNMDCVRDILLEVEGKSGFRKFVDFPDDFCSELRTKYSDDVIRYHIDQCYECGLLKPLQPGEEWDRVGNTTIQDLSASGHRYIGNIRSDNVWKKTKEVASSIGTFTIQVIGDIAASVISDLIGKKLG